MHLRPSSYSTVVPLLSLWPVIGLYIDGWAHLHRTYVETIFTPWHGLLYTGVATLLSYLVLFAFTTKERPRGFYVSLIAATAFLVSGACDLGWHLRWGIEISVEALISPPHLGLFVSAGVIVVAPLVARDEAIPRLNALSVGLALSMITFVLQFSHPITIPVASSEYRPAPTEAQEFFREALGISGIVICAALWSASLTVLDLWESLKHGSAAMALGVNGILLVGLSENFIFLVPIALAITAAEIYIASIPSRSLSRLVAVGCLVPLVFTATYFLCLAVNPGIWWSTPLWSGSIILSGIVGALTVIGMSSVRLTGGWQDA